MRAFAASTAAIELAHRIADVTMRFTPSHAISTSAVCDYENFMARAMRLCWSPPTRH